ncbi:MAG: Ig-like domain-containing protein [Clostridia bacterium]|nr:Ig-like domain-containing protein [Clostridia bacterium]
MKSIKSIVLIFLCISLILSLSSCSVLEEITDKVSNLTQGNSKIDDSEIIALCDRACMAAVIDENNGIGRTESSVLFATVDDVNCKIDTLKEVYTNHLDEIKGSGFYIKNADYDDDGTKECVFIINSLEPTWSGQGRLFSDSFAFEEDSFTGNYLAILHCDEINDETVIQAFAVKNASANSDVAVSWDEGVMRIRPYGNSSNEYTFCVNEADITIDNGNLSKSAIRNYGNYLNSLGYTDIKAQETDICDIEGNEVVFVYNNGGLYTADVFSSYMNKLFKFYSASDNEGISVFALTENNVDYLMNYTQDITPTGEVYDMNYSYTLYRFDKNFLLNEYNSDSFSKTNISANSEAENSFFKKFNDYLAKSVVCNDCYQVSGYRTTIGTEDTAIANLSYIKITNCNTTKTGVVNVPSNDFLHLRSGPSVNYTPVYTNSYGFSSLIQLLRGTPLTVLSTVNTGDRDDPVWLQVEVDYQGQTYVGYSSYSYITVDGIAACSVGGSIDINTTADSAPLTWETNDPAIATVDSNGILTGYAPGMVMVTVKSAAGFSDSCLVYVG